MSCIIYPFIELINKFTIFSIENYTVVKVSNEFSSKS